MATYVILSRFLPEAFAEPKDFRKLADAVSSRIKKECKGVAWKQSFATLGRFDVVDIVEADDPKDIERAAMIIPRPWTFNYGNAGRHSVERISCSSVVAAYAEGRDGHIDHGNPGQSPRSCRA